MVAQTDLADFFRFESAVVNQVSEDIESSKKSRVSATSTWPSPHIIAAIEYLEDRRHGTAGLPCSRSTLGWRLLRGKWYKGSGFKDAYDYYQIGVHNLHLMMQRTGVPFLTMQEYGSWSIRNDAEMEHISQIMVAFVLRAKHGLW